MIPREYLQNKNIVVMGLGVFGGGVASAKFCAKHGAKVLVTDLRDETTLAESLKQFTKKERDMITFVLGEHRGDDFKNADVVIVNPGVPNTSPYLKLAKEHGAVFENDASLFFRFSTLPTIGVTGTRGKTTTVNWITQLLFPHLGTMEPIGNSSNNPLLNELSKERTKSLHVAELSSWQLEILPQSKRAPHIAIITNIYPDHLNRYRGIKDYADAKANIFKHQTKNDFLILNHASDWRDFYLGKKPKGHVYFFSLKKLPKRIDGIFLDGTSVIFQEHGIQITLLTISGFEKKWGSHNTANLLAALLAIRLYDPKIKITQKQLKGLNEIPYRQQTTFQNKTLRVINDSTATSPDGLIAAIKRFHGKDTVFIAGGTRKDVSFDDAARALKKYAPAHNLVLLSGSATNDLLTSLKKVSYQLTHITTCDTLDECVAEALTKKPRILVFSPGAASFEKFKNEFDRGEQFNAIVRKRCR
jgi:UDP-N-acetylmuramoylalanine--D-glutamate ligase